MESLTFKFAFLVLTWLAVNINGSDGLDAHLAYCNKGDHRPSSLRYIYAFFRHGIRSPLYKPYPNDANKSKYDKYFPGPPGELTEIGKKIMYNIGKKLKSVYGHFIGEYADEKFYISSTNMSRTIMTALSVMAGLFPPSKPIFKDLPWQPIPVWHDTTELDKAYIYNDENFPAIGLKDCPRYGALIKKGYDFILKPDLNEKRQLLYKLVQRYTGKPDVNSVDSMYRVWDTLQFESLNGLPLPAWATKYRPHFHNSPLYPNVMEPIMVDWFLDTEYFNRNEEMLNFYTGPIFNSIHNHFQTKLEKPHSPGKMRFHSTHDTTLFALLWGMKLWKPATVGPGDGIIFELHEVHNTPIVKVYYFDANHHTMKELELPLCSSPCSLKEFIEATPGLTPHQWQEKCEIFS